MGASRFEFLILALLGAEQDFFENRPWKMAARDLNKSEILKLVELIQERLFLQNITFLDDVEQYSTKKL